MGACSDFKTNTQVWVYCFSFDQISIRVHLVLGLCQGRVILKDNGAEAQDLEPCAHVQRVIIVAVTCRYIIIIDKGRGHLNSNLFTKLPGGNQLGHVGHAIGEFVFIFRAKIFIIPGIHNNISKI